MMEAVRTSETSVDNHFTRQYNPEDNSEHHTRRRENLKSHMNLTVSHRIIQGNDCVPSLCAIVFRSPTASHVCSSNGQ
jgi:hypothetical protein